MISDNPIYRYQSQDHICHLGSRKSRLYTRWRNDCSSQASHKFTYATIITKRPAKRASVIAKYRRKRIQILVVYCLHLCFFIKGKLETLCHLHQSRLRGGGVQCLVGAEWIAVSISTALKKPVC